LPKLNEAFEKEREKRIEVQNDNINLQSDMIDLQNEKIDLQNCLARENKAPVTYEATSDKTFEKALRTLSQSIYNLAISVQPPGSLLNIFEDRTGFLGRNQSGGDEAWRCFLRAVAFDTILEGFFHWPLGLGVFGKDGEKLGKLNANHSNHPD